MINGNGKLNDNLKRINERMKASVSRKVNSNHVDDVTQNGLIKAWQHLSKIDNLDLTDKDINYIAKTHSNRVVADLYLKINKEIDKTDLSVAYNNGSNDDELFLSEVRMALQDSVNNGEFRGHYLTIAKRIIDNPTVNPVEIMKDVAKSDSINKSTVSRFRQKLADII
jgi:hypothetical protein